MRIVFSNKVMINIPKVVSYMKNNMGCDYNTIQNIVKTMLRYVQDKINKDGSNYNHAYIYQSCWWSDGNSGIGWIYDYCSFPRQGFAVVYNMRYDQVKNILENAKPLQSIKSLIERIEGKNVINENIYKPIKHDGTIPIENGAKVECVSMISDGYGTFAIGIDDGCYVIFTRQKDGTYKMYETTYIFPELFRELKNLPTLPLR